MIKEIDFTVITPVFNGEKYIEETILSVLNCTQRTNFEYIVVNDGSTDETLTIINKYKKTIKIINQLNTGEANAINSALKIALGRYCLIVSADDPLISEELFELAKEILDDDKEVMVVYPDWLMINELNELVSKIKTDNYSENLLIGEFKCLPGPGAIFRTKIALLIGGRNSKYRFASDYDFWLRLSQYGRFVRIPKYLAQWRNHQNSTSINSKGYSMAIERIVLMENFIKEYKLNAEIAKSALAHAYYKAALLSYFTFEVPGRKWVLKALRINQGWLKGSKPRIVLYLLLFPASFRAMNFLRKSFIRRLLPQWININE
jgi:glycosyltransferase involved in cell wall biosynthesis